MGLDKLYSMGVGEVVMPNADSVLTRVPGGWVYSDVSGVCFIPYNTEFKPKKPKQPKQTKKFIPPTQREVVQYFKERGYMPDRGRMAWAYYNSAGWKDSTGKPVRSWKQKMIGVWMKPEYKIQTKPKMSNADILA